jgi:hypothetical protein
MSRKTRSNTSLNSLEKRAKEVTLKSGSHVFILSAPSIQALTASSILCRAIRRAGGQFHLAISFPVMDIDSLNELRATYANSQVLVIGLEILGNKKPRKGKSYPVFVGCAWESDHISDHSIGGLDLIPAPAYALAQANLEVSDYELQLAAIGTILQNKYEPPSIKAENELIDHAMKTELIEKETGFRMFGATVLPLDEVFISSTRPYLKGISGNRKACDEILSNADIPTTALSNPITSLNPNEAKRLNQNILAQGTDVELFLGEDYVLKREAENSPVRTLSGIEGIHATAWAITELGTIAGILLGDRGISLRSTLDQHMKHHRDVISSVQHIESSKSPEAQDIITVAGSNDSILTDIGRVLLESDLVETSQNAIALTNENVTEIVWNDPEVSLYDAIKTILAHDAGANPITTSQSSLRFTQMGDAAANELAALILQSGGK